MQAGSLRYLRQAKCLRDLMQARKPGTSGCGLVARDTQCGLEVRATYSEQAGSLRYPNCGQDACGPYSAYERCSIFRISSAALFA
jgi:hypothetical protein